MSNIAAVDQVYSDAETVALVEQLETVQGEERARESLARIMWSRITEPGDRTASILIRVLGAERVLELLHSGDVENPAKISASIFNAHNQSEHATLFLSEETIRDGVSRWMKRLDPAVVASDVTRAAAHRMQLVLPGDPDWPGQVDSLNERSAAPHLLWVHGDTGALEAPLISIVGARACAGYGAHITAELADGLGSFGITIASGGAYGVDATAHRTALAGDHQTVAVVSGGLDRPYPQAHTALLEKIAANGAVIS